MRFKGVDLSLEFQRLSCLPCFPDLSPVGLVVYEYDAPVRLVSDSRYSKSGSKVILRLFQSLELSYLLVSILHELSHLATVPLVHPENMKALWIDSALLAGYISASSVPRIDPKNSFEYVSDELKWGLDTTMDTPASPLRPYFIQL